MTDTPAEQPQVCQAVMEALQAHESAAYEYARHYPGVTAERAKETRGTLLAAIAAEQKPAALILTTAKERLQKIVDQFKLYTKEFEFGRSNKSRLLGEIVSGLTDNAGNAFEWLGDSTETKPAPASGAEIEGLLAAFQTAIDAYHTCASSGLATDVIGACHGDIIAAFAAMQAKIPNSRAATDVMDERRRQIELEGWTPEYDDKHADGSLAFAAASYCCVVPKRTRADTRAESIWPWEAKSFKPKDRRTNLVRAGALILAEIERLDRAALAQGGKG